MTTPVKSFPVDIIGVVDGDTINIRVSVGFDIQYTHPLRLAGINCPELPTADGLGARDYALQWLFAHQAPYTLQTHGEGRDKYSRLLGKLWSNDGHCLNDDLLAAGHAVVMKG